MDELHYTRELLINNREFIYKGIFKLDDLFSVINHVLEEKDYVKREKKTEEMVTESGRTVYLELRPYKEVSEYAKISIKIKINLENVTETKVDGQKFHNGGVRIGFDAWYLTSPESRWNMKPWVFFLKGVVNKYLYTWPLEAGFKRKVVSDTAIIYGQVKKLFKSYQPNSVNVVNEEEVIKEVEKEINQSE